MKEKQEVLKKSKSWVKLYRQFLKWEWYDDINTCRLFLHLLLKANYVSKNWRGQLIKRGQLATGRKKLSEETGLSEQEIRTALTKLKSTNEITSQSTNEYTILTIVKYNTYQDKQPTNQQTSNQRATTTIEGIERVEGIEHTYMSFIAEFNKIVGSEHKGDSKSKGQFNARVKEGKSLEDFIKAVTNASKDKYLMGENNSGRRFLTPDYITRANTLDNWLSQKPKDKWAGYK